MFLALLVSSCFVISKHPASVMFSCSFFGLRVSSFFVVFLSTPNQLRFYLNFFTLKAFLFLWVSRSSERLSCFFEFLCDPSPWICFEVRCTPNLFLSLRVASHSESHYCSVSFVALRVSSCVFKFLCTPNLFLLLFFCLRSESLHVS